MSYRGPHLPVYNPEKSPLTPRQLEALKGLCSGKSNKEISEQMGITEQVAKNYLRQVYQRLGVGTRTAAVVQALNSGLVTPGA